MSIINNKNYIVIPVGYKRGKELLARDLVVKLLESIKHGNYLEHFNVVVCFDNVSEDLYEFIDEQYPFIHGLVNTGNSLGFARNSNNGMRLAKAENPKAGVLLVNQDCVLPDYKYLKPLTEVNGISTPYTVDIQRVDLLNRLNESNNEPPYEINSKFAFFCPFISSEVITEIGFLDGAFISSFEDDDYITRARLAGFKCFQYNVAVSHKGSHIDQSNGSLSGAYDGELVGLNLDKYVYKYGIDMSNPDNVIKTPQGNYPNHSNFLSWILSNREYNKDLMYIK